MLDAYTWSKLISDVEIVQDGVSLLQDHFNRRAERAAADIDIPHRSAGSFSWELPFGRQ